MRAFSESETNQSVWLHWLAVMVAVVGLFFFYKVTFLSLFSYWNEYGTYSHGYLTVLLCMYLLYTCVKEEELTYTKPSIFSAFCLFFVSVVWLCAYLVKINTLQALCLPIFLYFTLTYFCGLKNFRKLIIPISILLFTIPVWRVFLPYLQDISVFVTERLLSFSDVKFHIVENRVMFSRGIFEIEESCSGLRYLLIKVTGAR